MHQISAGTSDASFDAKLVMTTKRDIHKEIYETPEIILNISSSASCKAFFDKMPVMQKVYINEFCAKNSIIPDEAGEYDDWIEILQCRE